MKVDWTRMAPPGMELSGMRRTMITGLTLSVIGSFGFLFRYMDAYADLFDRINGVKVLHSGAMMPAFAELLGGFLNGFLIMAVVMLGFIFYHYNYHHQESKSIYLMRRLPSRWERHRRCLVLPIMAALFCVLCMVVILGLYYLIYRFCTPTACLPM